MSDLEMTKKCASAMEILWYHRARFFESPKSISEVPIAFDTDGMSEDYDPLHNDDQAMALMKKFNLCCTRYGTEDDWIVFVNHGDSRNNKSLNRAIVECVARLTIPIAWSCVPPRGRL